MRIEKASPNFVEVTKLPVLVPVFIFSLASFASQFYLVSSEPMFRRLNICSVLTAQIHVEPHFLALKLEDSLVAAM